MSLRERTRRGLGIIEPCLPWHAKAPLFIMGAFVAVVCLAKPTEAGDYPWCSYYNFQHGGATNCEKMRRLIFRAFAFIDTFAFKKTTSLIEKSTATRFLRNALDVRAFKLANGGAIGLTDAGVDKSLREKLRQTACARFSTVLGNGADAYHDSHVHLDLLERSNHYRICQWDVLDVIETAALAAKKAAAAAASNPTVVNVSDIPLPRPRPVVLSDLSRHRSVRLREAGQRPLFSLFAPLLKGMPR